MDGGSLVQRGQHLDVRINAVDFAMIFKGAVMLGSGLQLGDFTSGLASLEPA